MKGCENDPIGRLVYMTSIAMKNCLEVRLKPHDLTTEQFHVLKNLTTTSGITQNKLCEVVEKSPANMTRILDRLENKGCIERGSNPDDRRSTLVYLTAEGEKLLEEVRGEFSGFEQEIAKGLSSEQLQQVKDGLRVIHANIIEMVEREEK